MQDASRLQPTVEMEPMDIATEHSTPLPEEESPVAAQAEASSQLETGDKVQQVLAELTDKISVEPLYLHHWSSLIKDCCPSWQALTS